MGRVEPESIARDGTAECPAVVLEDLDRRARLQASRAQIIIQILRLQARAGVGAAEASRPGVATLLRDDVELYAARPRLGGRPAGLDDDLLNGLRVVAVDVEAEHVLVEPVHVDGLVGRTLAVHAELSAFARRAAGILEGRIGIRGARDERRVLTEPLRCGNRVQHLARNGRLLTSAGDIDHRRFSRDGDRLRDAADHHVGVHGRGERAAQLDALAPDGAETGEAERHGVGPGPQLDDPVCAGAVGDGRARLFDEGGAGGLDGDARQEGPRCVPYDAGNATGGRLCQERNRQEETADREGHRSQKSHGYAP